MKANHVSLLLSNNGFFCKAAQKEKVNLNHHWFWELLLKIEHLFPDF